MNPKTLKLADILLAEDNPADVLLTQTAFKEFHLANSLHVVEDGEEVLDFLNRRGEYGAAPRPDLIILDLNLPRKNGHEVLAEMKVDPRFQQIPVVVLTTSHSEADVLKAYGLHANCYIVKPVGFANFLEAIRSIGAFWFSIATLPSEVEVGKQSDSGPLS